MKTAIFWKTPTRLIVFSEKSTVKTSLNIADYSGAHIEMWEKVRKKYPALAFYEYDDFPRGRLVWNANENKYYFYADKNILNDLDAVNAILEQIGINKKEYPILFSKDSHYKTSFS